LLQQCALIRIFQIFPIADKKRKQRPDLVISIGHRTSIKSEFPFAMAYFTAFIRSPAEAAHPGNSRFFISTTAPFLLIRFGAPAAAEQAAVVALDKGYELFFCSKESSFALFQNLMSSSFSFRLNIERIPEPGKSGSRL